MERSSPASRANRNASDVDVLPTFSSLSLIRKIGEMRICSLWRKFVEITVLQKPLQPPERLPRIAAIVKFPSGRWESEIRDPN